jgi:hypothetical protein
LIWSFIYGIIYHIQYVDGSKLCYGQIIKLGACMLTLQINNPNIENIFLEGFNSNKDKFLEFIEQSYQHMMLKESFERSIRQAKLQESGELEELSLDELIDELKDNTNA